MSDVFKVKWASTNESGSGDIEYCERLDLMSLNTDKQYDVYTRGLTPSECGECLYYLDCTPDDYHRINADGFGYTIPIVLRVLEVIVRYEKISKLAEFIKD